MNEQPITPVSIIHETVLVHGIDGKPRNLLEQMSVRRDQPVPGDGWKYSHGWTFRGTDVKFDLYTRQQPLVLS